MLKSLRWSTVVFASLAVLAVALSAVAQPNSDAPGTAGGKSVQRQGVQGVAMKTPSLPSERAFTRAARGISPRFAPASARAVAA